jgi:hypothetical protein
MMFLEPGGDHLSGGGCQLLGDHHVGLQLAEGEIEVLCIHPTRV